MALVALESLAADLLESGEVFAHAVVVVDPALGFVGFVGLMGFVFVASVVRVGAVVARPPARRRCAAAVANNAQRANRPRRRRFAHTRRVFAAVLANRRRRRRFARSERSRWPTLLAGGAPNGSSDQADGKARARTVPAVGREPKTRARAAFGVLITSSPRDEPKTANTAAFWVAHHADPGRTPPPASPPARPLASLLAR